MFTKNELEVLLILLNRVDIKGSEALNVAVLMQKINNLVKADQGEKESSKDKDESGDK